MATRPVFRICDKKPFVKEINIEFLYYSGFSIVQKQKSIKSLHMKYTELYPSAKLLEVSTKSKDSLGKALSAFNLMIPFKNNMAIPVEGAFQGSKVFESGGPYIDLLSKLPREIKKDSRLHNSGRLIKFQYGSRSFELMPRTFFYDWLYVNALNLNSVLAKQVIEFDSFTDIEFNPKKSLNCQARSVALFVSLYKQKLINEALKDPITFKEVVYEVNSNKDDWSESQQLTFWD
jgi:type I restriction enzyme M protein